MMHELIETLARYGITGIHNYIVVMFTCCISITIASFVDMWSGIDAARTNHEPISSKSLRRTVSKVVDYLRVVIFGALIDGLGLFFTWYVAPYAMILITVGIIVIECRSVMENSRKKKSHAADIADVVKQIIECADEKDAKKLVSLIKSKEEKK